MRTNAKLVVILSLVLAVAGAVVLSAGAALDARSAMDGNVLISYAGAHAWDCEVINADSSGVSTSYEFQVMAEWEASSSGDPPAQDTSVDAEWGVDHETSTVYHDTDNDSNHSDTWVGDLEQVQAWTGSGGSLMGGGSFDFSVTAWIYSTHSASWSNGSPSEVTDVIEQDWGNTLCPTGGNGNGGGNFY